LKELFIPDTLQKAGVGCFGYDSPYSRIEKVWCHAGTASAQIIDRFVSPSNPEYQIMQIGEGDAQCLCLMKYFGNEQDITLPTSIDGIPATEVGYACFASIGANSITIPVGFTALHDRAFESATIKEVVIPEGTVSIGDQAFKECINLTEVIIPQSVTFIGKEVFSKCSMLEAVSLPSELSEIPEEAFYECRRLKTVNIPETIVSIGANAFCYCDALNELYIPDTLQIAGVGCFGYDSPYSRIEKIWCHAGTYASNAVDRFVSPSAPSFRVCEGGSPDDRSLSLIRYLDVEESVTIPNMIDSVPVRTLEYGLFNSSRLKYVTIPDSITYIDNNAFASTSKLTIITTSGSYAEEFASKKRITIVLLDEKIDADFVLPCSLKTIEDEAFEKCAFVSVRLKDGIEVIGKRAFADCANLRQIEMPDSVKHIAPDAFDGNGLIIIFCQEGSYAKQYADEHGIMSITE